MLPRLIRSKLSNRFPYAPPTRWGSFSSSDEFQFWQHSKVPTMHFQKSLPRLPIPELSKTCERYLQAQRPLLNGAEFEKTEAYVQRFLSGEGVSLHKELKDHDGRNKHTSYISEPWFDMYLRDRVPLPLNYNPALVFIDDPNRDYNDQLVRATNLLISSLRFMRSLRAGILEPEVFHLNPKKSDTQTFRTVTRFLPPSVSWYGAYMFNAYPLDMSQFKGLFNATRIPQVGKDVIFQDQSARHMLVLRNGNFFVFDVLDSAGSIKSPNYIMSCLKFILDDETPVSDFPLGFLTTENRNTWANVRKHLEISGNKEALELIDSGIFCLCLDDKCVEDSPDTTLQWFLCSNGGNRWFDKSFSLIVSRDGKAAVNFEHSWGDGVAVLRYCQDILKDSTRNPHIHPNEKPASSDLGSVVRKLDIQCDDVTKNNIVKAKKKYEELTRSLGISGFLCDAFGSKLCKSAKISPDSVMQLGFQSQMIIHIDDPSPEVIRPEIAVGKIAYNKLSQGYAGTYESCSTSAFKHGRTETVRPCTSATKAFCEAIKSPNTSKEELRKMLKTCSDVHGNLVKEAATGQGFDRHLFVLRKISERRGEPLPDIYKDEAFSRLNYHIVSTSTLSSDALSAGGFGPVVKDGFGIGYRIMENGLGTLVTNYPEYSDGAGFMRCLEEAFETIYKVLK